MLPDPTPVPREEILAALKRIDGIAAPKSKSKPKGVSWKHGKPLKRSWMRNGAGSKRRKGHMFPKNVDEARREFIRSLPCVLQFELRAPAYQSGFHNSHDCTSPTRACHLKSRGSGGKDAANMWPGCDAAHREQHRLGIPVFNQRWHVDLGTECTRREAEYLEMVERGGIPEHP